MIKLRVSSFFFTLGLGLGLGSGLGLGLGLGWPVQGIGFSQRKTDRMDQDTIRIPRERESEKE